MADQKPQHGTFCWNELITTDTGKASNFYTSLLGWEKTAGPGGMDYTMWKAGEAMAGGMMGRTPEMGDVPSHWMSYITVDDVDALASKIEGLGGKIICPPMDIPEVGRFLILQDPTGATVGLITFPKK